MKKLSLLLLVCVIALSGCGSKSSSADFKVATGGEPKQLDTAVSSDSVTHIITAQMYDTLYNYDQKGNLVPNLAKDLKVSEDGLTYTVTLVDTVWSDGEKLVADHFVYGAKRALNFGDADSYYSYYIHQNIVNGQKNMGKPISQMTDLGIKAIDDLTLEFTIVKPIPYFNQLLTGEVFAPQREDVATEGDSMWANKPGVPTTGAYTLKSVREGAEYVLEKNPNYRDADKVKNETIQFLVMEDQQAQLNAFKAGEIDLATNVPSDVVNTFKGKPELTIFEPYVINYFISLNAFTSDQKALEDDNVRRALALAVDRSQIIKSLDGGDLQYELFGLVPKGIPGVKGDFREEQDKTNKYLETDKAAATELLAKAGYTNDNPLKLTYSYNSNQMHDTVAQALQAMWKEVGIDVTLTPAETRVFFDARDNGDFQLARHAMSADFLDPMIYLEMYDSRNQLTPVINDPVYDAKLDAANAEKDPAKRMEMLHDAEKYLVEEKSYVIPLIGYTVPYLLKAGTKNLTSTPQATLDLKFVELP